MREMALPRHEMQDMMSTKEKIANLLKKSGEWFDQLGKEVGRVVMISTILGGAGGAVYEGHQTLQHVSDLENPSMSASLNAEHATDKPEEHLGLMLGGLALAGAGLFDYGNRKFALSKKSS